MKSFCSRSGLLVASSCVALALAFLVLAVDDVARAQSPEAQSPELTARAREHFQRGLQLVDEQRFEAALAEFELAYRLRPAFQVLYNIGVVQDALEHTVEAVDILERYLREGGDRIAPARRAEVEALLAARRRLIARVVVRVNVDGATVAVDGHDIGRAPLATPIRLTAGAHTLSVRAAGHESEQRALRLAGDVEETLVIELRPLPAGQARLVVRCAIPDVEIRLGDTLIARTPIDGPQPVPGGRHVLTATRAGYRPFRQDVDLVASTDTAVDVVLTTDPEAAAADVGRVRLVLPNARYELRVDDVPMRASNDELRLARGRHGVALSMEDREDITARIDVPSGGIVDLRPRFRWNRAALAREIDDAASRRTLGWVLSISGAVLVVATVPLLVWNESRLTTAEYDAIRVMDEQCDREPSVACTDWRGANDAAISEYNSTTTSVDALRYVGLGAALVGAAALAFGIERIAGAPDRAAIDDRASARRAPRLRLAVGWGSVTVSGAL